MLRQQLQARASKIAFSWSPLLGITRWSSTVVNVHQLRVGTYFKLNGDLYEVVSNRRVVFGRNPAYYLLDYKSVKNPGEILKGRFASDQNLEKTALDRVDAVFMYTDYDKQRAIVADKDFSEMEIPLSFFPERILSKLQGGEKVTLWKHEGELLSLTAAA